MFEIKKNKKNKSAVILNPERREWVSRSHVTSVEFVINDRAKTKPHHALRRSLQALAYGSTLKMTEKALSFLSRCCASDIVGIRHVITRRTSVRRGYLPEKCTHANKESLFAIVTCFMRLPRRIQRMLLVMTIPVLAIFFTLITTTESWAECGNGSILCGGSCHPLGKYNATSAHCDNGKLVIDKCIYSSGYYLKDGKCVYCPSMPATCHWDPDQGKVIIDECKSGNILCGGRCEQPSAYATSSHCDEATGKIVADKCKYDGYILCGGRCKHPGMYNATSAHCDEDTGNLVADKCNSGYKVKNGTCLSRGASCGDGYVEGDGVCYKIPDGCESASATDGSCTKCSAGLSFDDDNNCIECNKKGYKNVGGYCNRVQWTPAEAARVLKDDNTNEITITFKK